MAGFPFFLMVKRIIFLNIPHLYIQLLNLHFDCFWHSFWLLWVKIRNWHADMLLRYWFQSPWPYPGNGIVGSYGSSFFSFLRNCHPSFPQAWCSNRTHQPCSWYLFFSISSPMLLSLSFFQSLSWQGGFTIPREFHHLHFSFLLIPDDIDHLFIDLLDICWTCLLWKMPIQVLCPFLIRLFSFFFCCLIVNVFFNIFCY